MNIAMKGCFCCPNASKAETHHRHLLRHQNLPIVSRNSFHFSTFYTQNNNDGKRKSPPLRILAAAAAAEEGNYATNVTSTSGVKGSGTTARGRRLLKIREDKRKRELDRLHNYPAWAKVLENACKDDEELRAVLGDSIGDPELMRKRVEERVRKKGRDFHKQKTGSVLSFKVSFRE